MRKIRDEIMLCDDCTIAAVNGDFTGLDYSYGAKADERRTEIEAGLDALGTHLVPDHDSETGRGIEEFSRQSCACCGTTRHGQRHAFAILGN